MGISADQSGHVAPAGVAGIATLTGDHRGFLGAAIAAAGATLLSSRARQVNQQSRGGAVASYQAEVRWPDGSVTTETLAACTGSLPAGAFVVDDGRTSVAVWRFPHDPDLPGLPSAVDHSAVSRLFGTLGLGDDPVRITTRAYRPRRRAVIAATGSAGQLFVKAVRPRRVEALHHRHRLLVANEVPAAHSLGWTDDGLLVLQAVPGPTLRQAIRSGSTELPSGAAVLELLDRLPAALADGPSHPSWLDRVHHHAAVAAAIMPAESSRLTGIADAIHAEAGTGPTVPVHGDLYESQLIVRGASISGLLDIDGAGPGDRLDDLGCLLGHLSVLATVDRPHQRRINAVGAGYLAAFERSVDRSDLRYRTAAVVVSLIAGPHRVQDPDWPTTTRALIDLADRWLASARTTRRMRQVSSVAHPDLTATVDTDRHPRTPARRPTT